MLPDAVAVPGYKHPCRFCGQLVEANSPYCPHCTRPHPHQMVCPWCFAPIQAGWRACNKCGMSLIVRCNKCGNEVGPDSDACEKCGTVIRHRCPTCAAVVTPGDRRCARCGQKLGEFWKKRA